MACRSFLYFLLLAVLSGVNAYWLMGIEDFITTERLDPVVNPGKVSSHAHSVLGGSNFRMSLTTKDLRNSECTSIPITQDKSSYWFPHLYFQWANGSFSSLKGAAVIYYLFPDQTGLTKAFPDDFRMLSGNPTLRTYDPSSYAQQAITFLCLDFNGVTTRYNSLPVNIACASGIRAQINFPSCWDGKNVDSPDHKSHVAFLSGGPDSGACIDPKYPVRLPRIFIEVYWTTSDFETFRSQAKNTTQPYVYSYGDPTGYGYHADFYNGWESGFLQNAVDKCHCDIYGSPKCCADAGIFTLTEGKTCRITKAIDEATTGTLPKLPGNNPVQKEGTPATLYADPEVPVLLSPIYAYTGATPTATGTPVKRGTPNIPTPPSYSTAPGQSTTPKSPTSSPTASIHVTTPTPSPSPGTIKPPVAGPGSISTTTPGHITSTLSTSKAALPTKNPSSGVGHSPPVLAGSNPNPSEGTCSGGKSRRNLQQPGPKPRSHRARAQHDKAHQIMRPHARDYVF